MPKKPNDKTRSSSKRSKASSSKQSQLAASSSQKSPQSDTFRAIATPREKVPSLRYKHLAGKLVQSDSGELDYGGLPITSYSIDDIGAYKDPEGWYDSRKLPMSRQAIEARNYRRQKNLAALFGGAPPPPLPEVQEELPPNSPLPGYYDRAWAVSAKNEQDLLDRNGAPLVGIPIPYKSRSASLPSNYFQGDLPIYQSGTSANLYKATTPPRADEKKKKITGAAGFGGRSYGSSSESSPQKRRTRDFTSSESDQQNDNSLQNSLIFKMSDSDKDKKGKGKLSIKIKDDHSSTKTHATGHHNDHRGRKDSSTPSRDQHARVRSQSSSASDKDIKNRTRRHPRRHSNKSNYRNESDIEDSTN